jgi:glycosyltransferase involved in cell wall biosynthesis
MQTEMGHEVGLFCDSSTGGTSAELLLAEASDFCSLGIKRQKISKLPGLGDVSCARAVKSHAKLLGADVIHGHGAKGGLYGRLAGKLSGIPSIYTPHGGSLHYEWSKFPGPIYLGVEKALGYAGSGFVFVCEFEKKLFAQKIGLAGKPSVIVHNGLWPEEFTAPIVDSDATDFLFVGEMRKLKGVDILLNAMAELNKSQKTTLTLVGDGPEMGEFESLAASLNLQTTCRFVGRKTITTALKMGHVMVVPSRNESFPYVVLETIAASVPIISSDVGGIAEILPQSMLISPIGVAALAEKMKTLLLQPNANRFAAQMLAEKAKTQLSVNSMATKICEFYQFVTTR